MFIYDIVLNDVIVGDSGDEIFNTKEEARADADDLIISCLEDEYGKDYRDFGIIFYEGNEDDSYIKENDMDNIFICSICGGTFTGFGNNPYPVTKGEHDRCCDDCNSMYVIPARLNISISKDISRSELKRNDN